MARVVYHVQIGKKRTPVTLASVLTLKLGKTPRRPEGHQAVRMWLQEEIDRDPGAVRYGRASQRLTHVVIAKRDQWQDQS